MDRPKTIFVNIAHFIDAYDMEMHTFYGVSRRADINETVLFIEDDKRIRIPMLREQHNNFMKGIYNNQEIWFSCIGYIQRLNLTEWQEEEQNYLNNKLYNILLSKNKKIDFSVIGGKN